MAVTNELLQAHVTCPVCLDVFEDPHSLECRHIVCFPCLKRLQVRGPVQCPECRQMPLKRIKRDFKTAKLAENFKKEKEEKSKEGVIPDCQPKGCGVCKIPGKLFVCWCKTCDKYLCQSCELAHKGVPVTMNHVIRSQAQIVAALQDRARNSMGKCEGDLDKIERGLFDISAHIASMNASKETQEAEIDALIDQLINQLEDRRAQLKHELTEGNAYIFETLTQTRKVFENHKPLLESSIKFLKQLSTSEDLETLMTPEAIATYDRSQQSKKIEGDFHRLERRDLPNLQVKVVKGPGCNVKAYVFIYHCYKRNVFYADLLNVRTVVVVMCVCVFVFILVINASWRHNPYLLLPGFSLS